MRLTKNQLSLAKTFLRHFDELAHKNCSEQYWLMLKFGCDEATAARLVTAARKAMAAEAGR